MGVRANTTSVVGAATSAAVPWDGGRTMVVYRLSAGSGAVILQFLDAVTGIWVNLSAGVTANGVEFFDLAQGSYRLNVAAATTAQAILYKVRN